MSIELVMLSNHLLGSLLLFLIQLITKSVYAFTSLSLCSPPSTLVNYTYYSTVSISLTFSPKDLSTLSELFHFAYWTQGPSMLLQILGFPFFLWLNNIPLLIYIVCEYVFYVICNAPLFFYNISISAAMQEMWVQSLDWEDPLEKGRATHSRILAWRDPWTEEPSGLQSKRLQRVRHD